MIAVERVGKGPILHPGLCDSIGDNLNGPTMLRAPDWAAAPAAWLLYFAHHEGRHIRLALADRPEGPWRIHRGGVLDLADTWFAQAQPDAPQPAWAVARGVNGLYPHIASPDVRIDHAARRFTMLFHGLCDDGVQRSARAHSADGLVWAVEPRPVADNTYLRAFEHGGLGFALARGGEVLALGDDGVYHGGHWPFDRAHRHAGVLRRGDTLHVLWTRIGDAPEAILHSTIALTGNWRDWQVSSTGPILAPERPYEGADEPRIPTPIGTAAGRENGLRDPWLVEDDGTLWLVYAGAGESNICLARLTGL